MCGLRRRGERRRRRCWVLWRGAGFIEGEDASDGNGKSAPDSVDTTTTLLRAGC